MLLLRWLTIGLALTLTLELSAFQKTEEDYWRDLKLPPSLLGAFDTKLCIQNRKAFLGCIEAYNQLLSHLNPPGQLAVEQQQSNPRVLSGGFSLIEAPEPAVEPSEAALLHQNFRSQRAGFEKHWIRVWRSGLVKKLDFSKLQAWVIEHVLTPAGPQEASPRIAGAINSFLQMRYDPHTRLVPSALIQEQSLSESHTFGGVGIQIVPHASKFVVAQTIEEGPAAKSGIRTNDVLISVGDKSLEGVSIQTVSTLLRGEVGSPVKVGVRRGDEVHTFELIRSLIKDENVEASVLKSGDHKYGVIKIKSFMPESTCSRVRGSLHQLESQSVEAWVLDLRQNLGGRVDQAVCILGLFVGPNRIGLITKQLPELINSHIQLTQEQQITTLPMVTLIDALSASASEVIAGDLQDYQRSYVLGTRSFGKGTVQAIYGLNSIHPGINEVITIGRFYVAGARARPEMTAGERTNYLVGIQPDFIRQARPDWHEENVFSFREEDYYTNPEYPADGAWVQPRPEEIAHLDKCMQYNGQAEKTVNRQGWISADYQLLSAADLLNCKLAQSGG